MALTQSQPADCIQKNVLSSPSMTAFGSTFSCHAAAPTPFVLIVASEGVGVTLPLVLTLTKESSACTVGRTMTRPPRAGLLRW